MQIFDDLIKKVYSLINQDKITYTFSDKKVVDEDANFSFLLNSDVAFDLGGGDRHSVGFFAATTSRELVENDEIIVIGKELNEINQSTNFARITIVALEKDLEDDDESYDALTKIDRVKYKFFPKDVMIRVSPLLEKEEMRIGKKALENGLTLEKLGNTLINNYHKQKFVRAVKLIYINTQDFDYDTLSNYSKLSIKILDTMDHIYKNMLMDCHSCKLKTVCDEVEGMKELNFKQVNK